MCPRWIDHPRYLLRLIELELSDRERRTIERRIRAARFPAVKSFDTFDFVAIPGLNKMLVLELARCEYGIGAVLRPAALLAIANGAGLLPRPAAHHSDRRCPVIFAGQRGGR